MSENTSFLIKDLIQGDEKVSLRPEFLNLEGEDIRQALSLILNQKNISNYKKQEILNNIWRVHYRLKPPTIEEFLTEEWIGPTAESLFPHVTETLKEVWAPTSPYRHLVLGAAIGTGKSMMSALWSLYITTHLSLMRNNKKFFGLSQATSIVQALISFTLKKAEQLLLQPFYQILLSSPKFHRVRMEERLNLNQKENPDKICWTSAGLMGALQFYNDVHYMIASSPAQLLGLNMITAILSEISFFMERGFSSEYIWRIYGDSKSRVRSRFEGKYFSGTVIDSSPNDIELSPIDKYIFQGDAKKNPENYVMIGSQWKYLPEKFPEWQKTGKTFPVFKGSKGEPAQILSNKEVSEYKSEDIYNVPIDLHQLFVDNTLKNVKDFCGWPSGSSGTLIREDSVIEKMFSSQLKNVYSYIMAPSSQSSTRLIWNIVAPKFFIKHDKGYEFYRNPLELRYIHIDQAETGDMASISMVHPETNKKGEIIYITDFTVAISPEKERINLDAIRLFIQDLRDIGKLKIGLVTFDQYQSKATIQYLKEKGFNVEILSVDREVNPYLAYISLLMSGKVKVGKNIFLKNNLKSLQEIRTSTGKKKIDHTKGKIVYEDDLTWTTSQMGKFAKDVSDSHCGAIWNCLHNYLLAPRMMWEEERETGKNYGEVIKEEILANLRDKYGLAI